MLSLIAMGQESRKLHPTTPVCSSKFAAASFLSLGGTVRNSLTSWFPGDVIIGTSVVKPSTWVRKVSHWASWPLHKGASREGGREGA